ncbi:MAG: cupin domain-containing protein [Alphaproteobacteria bacterium]|nr:cupin domain-containing protein [Alphaproteobacteria bacterium]
MVAVDTLALEGRRGTGYPAPFDAIVGERLKRVLGDPFGLTQFGVNLVHLPPGAGSSQRHWHSNEDEFVYILEGELILATDAGETKLTAGMAAGFPAGHPDAHHLINKSESMAIYIEIGTRAAKDACEYPGIDLQYRHTGGRGVFAHKDGTPYEK